MALKPFTDLEKTMALSLIGGLYEESEEPTKAIYYYDEAIKSAKRNLELRTLSPSEKIETLGQLALIYFNKKEYKQSSHYLDSMLQFALTERKFFIGKNELITVLEAYTYSGQKQRAIDVYYALLEKKKCKRNKAVEELLEIRFH